MAVEKTVEQQLAVAKSQLKQEQMKNTSLETRLRSQSGVKIPTAAQLKNPKPFQLTRDEQLRADLNTALNMTPEQIAKIRSDLAARIDEGEDMNELVAGNKMPELRFLIALEVELRKYVKRGKRKMRTDDGSGTKVVELKPGFKKGLSKPLRDFAGEIMKLLGRKELVWDESVPVPGAERFEING